MKIILAQASTAAAETSADHARALCDRLDGEGHRVERLDLPSVAAEGHILSNLASYRLLGTAASADALICLDPIAAALPHPRKLLWLFDGTFLEPEVAARDDHGGDERLYLARLLRRAMWEAQAVWAPSPFALAMLDRLGIARATLFAPTLAVPAVRYARNPGPELLVLAPLTQRHRPELALATLAALPEPFRVRWMAPFADRKVLARVRALASELRLEQRLAIDVRGIDAGEESYLLSQSAALIDLAPSSMAVPPKVRLACNHGVPVIAGADGGATVEVAQCGLPTPRDLAAKVVALCSSPAAPTAPRATAAAPGARQWAPLIKALAQ